jgi:anaerobic nitric oxide reductase transcription regulator
VADGGTIFLDEIGELPLTLQPKLLRALQEGEIQRVGADRPHRVDVRVLAATNRNIEAEVGAGRFRADLFHRLNVYPLHVPALRERRSDISLLAGFFCDLARRRLGLGPVRLSEAALAALRDAAWPGNVRELENVISRAVLQAAGRVERGAAVVVDTPQLTKSLDAAVDAAAAPTARSHPHEVSTRSLREATVDFQRTAIRQAVAAHDGNWAAAARSLGMGRSNLHHLAKRLGLR